VVNIKHFVVVDSTNDLAKRLASEGAPEWTVIRSDMQKKGRGRMGRRWISPRGGLWFSVILRPKIRASELPKLAIISGVSVAKILEKHGLSPRIKWPNDILINGKKVCGILVESEAEDSRIKYVVVGIGINVNVDLHSLPEEIRQNATTLKLELGRKVELSGLLMEVLEQLKMDYSTFEKKGFARARREWKRRSDTLGRRVKIIMPTESFEGYALDIDGEGALLVKVGENTQRVITGDCVHLGMI
jgi:BirA family biotin operon repressor/biotin-[acetyl-CoA-carboxylase] ligase